MRLPAKLARWIVWMVVVYAATGCISPLFDCSRGPEYHCDEYPNGMCIGKGCAYPDRTCPTGWRWGFSAERGQSCVSAYDFAMADAGLDGGTDGAADATGDAPLDVPADAPVDAADAPLDVPADMSPGG